MGTTLITRSRPDPTGAAARHRPLPPWAPPALIALAALLAYANSFSGPFVFDDASSIVTNPTLRHWWPPWAPLVPPRASLTVQGRPLLNLSLAVNYALSGPGVGSYHVANFLIHLAAALTLCSIVRRTLRRAGPAVAGHADALALAVALLWVVHPLQTESVTYIVQRTESLMGLCYLLTLDAFLRSLEGNARRWQAASVAACLAGMATKEVMVSAPLLVLLLDRTVVSGSCRAAWSRRRGYYLALASTWLLLAFLILGTGGNRGGSKGFDVGVSWGSWWLTQFPAVAHYLRLAVWPHPLVFEYGVEWTHPPLELAAGIAVVAALVGGTIVAVGRRSPLGIPGVAFCAILAPTSLTPGTSQMTAEHRMYLPLAAVLTGLVVAGQRALGPAAPRLGPLLVGAATAGLAALTLQRNHDYRSEIALWEDTLAKRPDNALAHEMLGLAQDRAGDPGSAAEHFRAALRSQPGFAIAHESLGALLFRQHDVTGAIAEFAAALQLKPDFPDAADNLGAALLAAGRHREAIPPIRAALALKPDYAEAHYNLATALAATGAAGEAIPEFEAALRLRPGYAAAHYNLANTLAAAGRAAEAGPHYEAVLALEPGNARAAYNLANTLAMAGHPAEAIPQYRRALALNPRSAEAMNNLGSALLETGDPTAAAAAFTAALKLDPQFADARENLRRLRQAQGAAP